MRGSLKYFFLLVFLFAFLFVSSDVFAFAWTGVSGQNYTSGCDGIAWASCWVEGIPLESYYCTRQRSDCEGGCFGFTGSEPVSSFTIVKGRTSTNYINFGSCPSFVTSICPSNDSRYNPGGSEVCGDNLDNNCNGSIDEDCSACADSIGGCNGIPKYCKDSPEYQSFLGFVQANPDIRQSWYFLTIGANGDQYKCLSFYKDGTGAYVLPITVSPSTIDPSKSSGCLTTTVWNAVECKYVLNAKYSGLSTKYGTGIAGVCIDPTTGAYINCSVSKTGVGDGKTITQDGATGRTIETSGDGVVTKDTASGSGTSSSGSLLCVDANKDGFDDTRGVPCSSEGSGIGTTGQVSKCIDVNKDMIDDVTGMPCFKDDTGQYQIKAEGNAPVYDTAIDTPSKSALGSLFSKAVTPVKNFITGSRLQVSGSFCSQTVTLLRKSYHLDLCPYESSFQSLGSVLLGMSVLMSVYLVFK